MTVFQLMRLKIIANSTHEARDNLVRDLSTVIVQPEIRCGKWQTDSRRIFQCDL